MQMKNFLTVTMVTVIAACLIACGGTKEATNQTTTPVSSEQNSTTSKENETSSTVAPTNDAESNSTEQTTKNPNSGFSSDLSEPTKPQAPNKDAVSYEEVMQMIADKDPANPSEYSDLNDYYKDAGLNNPKPLEYILSSAITYDGGSVVGIIINMGGGVAIGITKEYDKETDETTYMFFDYWGEWESAVETYGEENVVKIK